MEVARFMASPFGRLLRIAGGVAMILVGIMAFGGIGGWILAVAGLVPLLAGAMNFCFVGPLFGAPFRGRDVTKPV